MRFLNRKKKRSSESYYDYYGEHGVVPNTIEYYLEFGQEVDAEDIYWEDGRKDEDDEDGGSTIVSYKAGNIPVLTIVDASTNTPITSMAMSRKQPSAATSGGYSSSRRSYSDYTEDTSRDSTALTSFREDEEEEEVDDDVVEPGILETTLSEYEGVLMMKRQPSMNAKSFCTISTVGFKSAAASAAAAQEFASQYIRVKSRDGHENEDDKAAGTAPAERGEVEVEALLDDESLTISPSKSVISAPRKKDTAGSTLHTHSRIILHADAAGESMVAMSREFSFIPDNSVKGTIATQVGCALSPAAIAAVTSFTGITAPAAVASLAQTQCAASSNHIITANSNSPDMPSLLDGDDVSSVPAASTCNPNDGRTITSKSHGKNSLRMGSGFLKSSWFHRNRTNTSRQTRVSDSSTIATRATHQLNDKDMELDMVVTERDEEVVQNTDDNAEGKQVEVEEDEMSVAPTAAAAAAANIGPQPLALLFDDKRNEAAWLRCAPRRRNFDFPLTQDATSHFGETVMPTSEGDDVKEEKTSTKIKLDSESIALETTNPSLGGMSTADVEERDPPPSVLDSSGATTSTLTLSSTVDAAAAAHTVAPERHLSILGVSTDDDNDFFNNNTAEIETAGSTVTQYKKKLADLQRRHDAVVQLIQDF